VVDFLTASIALPVRRPVLAEALPTAWTRTGVTILLGTALTALAAQVSIPVPGSPVPITGQTFAVLLTAAALGPARGVASQGLYVLLGLVGLPVFAGASHGSGVVFGASGGYLFGFVAAAAIVGVGARRGVDRSPVRTLLLYALASVVIYAIGTTWLCLDTGMSASAGIAAGVTPFIPGDVAKALLAAGLLPGAWFLLGRGPAPRETPAEDAR
jgi:biotin transport system substrate-specific component